MDYIQGYANIVEVKLRWFVSHRTKPQHQAALPLSDQLSKIEAWIWW